MSDFTPPDYIINEGGMILKSDYGIGIYGFTAMFTVLAERVWEETNNSSILVLPAYPDEVVHYGERSSVSPAPTFKPCITYQVIRREPGAIGGDATGPFDGKKEHKPRLRETIFDSSNGRYVEVYGQRFDNLVQFDCWHKSNEEANNMVMWLEHFLTAYAGVFKRYGVQEMFYFRSGRFTWGTNEEEAMSRWRNPLKVRSLVWFIRTEDLFVVDVSAVRRIDVNVTLRIV